MSWQTILSFRDPQVPAKMMQFTATRPTKRAAEVALAELIVKRDRNSLVRNDQTFAMAADRWRKSKDTREPRAAYRD